jgi:hypothetical protein
MAEKYPTGAKRTSKMLAIILKKKTSFSYLRPAHPKTYEQWTKIRKIKLIYKREIKIIRVNIFIRLLMVKKIK